MCRTKLENQLQLLDSLERERAESAELRARLQRIETQYNAYVGGERELIELNERLEREAKELRVEVERFRESTTRDREQNDNSLVQHRAAWLEEKCNLQTRIEDLDGQLASATNTLSVVTATYKQVGDDFFLC
jgi:chromosome segregation ATPase